eukprot:TRINITY_DN2559_c0_g1_i4.p1 TRINITY_DN2559_c0_g1~~TRINITY_DN2559_c0_g1_i4.p1  ORF type:complete len:124 (+),score=15.64 TRINITY_DN2559_c0_g1_i4:58-429(+)
MQQTMNQVRIIGTGHSFPGDPVETSTIFDWLDITLVDQKWAADKLGIETRHVARECPPSNDNAQLKPGCQNSDLSATAILNALEVAKLDVHDLDMIICATCTPDCMLSVELAICCIKLSCLKN